MTKNLYVKALVRENFHLIKKSQTPVARSQ